ncbi:sensor domain-containing diguanylate cyclase [Sedimenticola selenatireducens]|nr:sensor domain-containing diguanylate cyclase [Sedimenticola selenatireducens]
METHKPNPGWPTITLMPNTTSNPSSSDLAFINRQLKQQLKALTREASHNEVVLKRFHDRELTLLATETLPELLSCLIDGMKSSFDLPNIKLVLHDPDHELRHLLLHSGIEPESLPDIRFIDQIEHFSPKLARYKSPWLGPFTNQDHALLFPDGTLLKSIAILPMLRRSKLVGLIGLGSHDPNRFTRHHASDFLNRLATISAICLENTANREHLVVAGLTDALTGLHNRRYLESRLEEEVTRALRYQHALSCLFIDADHFKRINDTHGHGAGDSVLREIALRVKECLRASDIATRYGGEEFALLLPQTDAIEACNLAERIRQRIEDKPIAIHGGESVSMTVSIGVAPMRYEKNANTQDVSGKLLDEADKSLYVAKESGRNQVQLAEQ